MRDVTVVISTIPPRKKLLDRAIESVYAQTELPVAISIAIDIEKAGGGPTRSRAMKGVTTTWMAHLDDDDVFLPHHLKTCLDVAEETGADVVVPWYDVVGGTDPFPQRRGMKPDPDGKYRNEKGVFPQFAQTNLVRTSFAPEVLMDKSNPAGAMYDYPYWVKLEEMGAKIVILEETTWLWHHDSQNTSGRPDRW